MTFVANLKLVPIPFWVVAFIVIIVLLGGVYALQRIGKRPSATKNENPDQNP